MRGIEQQFLALQKGFYEVVPANLLKMFDEKELELIIGGIGKIDLDDWKNNTKLKVGKIKNVVTVCTDTQQLFYNRSAKLNPFNIFPHRPVDPWIVYQCGSGKLSSHTTRRCGPGSSSLSRALAEFLFKVLRTCKVPLVLVHPDCSPSTWWTHPLPICQSHIRASIALIFPTTSPRKSFTKS